MGIKFNEENCSFNLTSDNMSYIIKIHDLGYPVHLYWGRRLDHFNLDNMLTYRERCSFSPNPDPNNLLLSLDDLPQEYPSYGGSDFRMPAFVFKHNDGTTRTELKYDSHLIYEGKSKLDGLPATYIENKSEATTLELLLVDSLKDIHVTLIYTVYANRNVVCRSVKVENKSDVEMRIEQALSMSIDFDSDQFDLMHLQGSWARERHVERHRLFTGTQGIQSRRGSSSHQHNPFVSLLTPQTNESQGEAYGFSLVYSGNFIAQAEVDQYHTTRVSMGINPFEFKWKLGTDEVFQTPECVMVYSSNGVGDLSRTYHKLFRERLARGLHRDSERPILMNNWEATYFDFNEKSIVDLARRGAELGVELFVLDDGWFGSRNGDKSGLGDWVVNTEKLPRGLDYLAQTVNDMDMKFGLWFEPEMVSPDSDLYRNHPDWCLHIPNRSRTEGRHQLVLDFSRQDVCVYITGMIKNILSSTNIEYVKWDMNRNMTEVASSLLDSERQSETMHRYMLGLYAVLEDITTSYPNILFESCSGGGGRFDPGMLYYMPQTWTSDNTDAVERLKIQYGTSMVYPLISMGAHVSEVPNHQVGRRTSLKMRGDVAMTGNFGYELDLTKISDTDKEIMKHQVISYKERRQLIQFGDMYRIRSPFDGNECAWMVVSEDKCEAVVSFYQIMSRFNGHIDRLKLEGLDGNKNYKIMETGMCLSGKELLNFGIRIQEQVGDYQSQVWHLKAVKNKVV